MSASQVNAHTLLALLRSLSAGEQLVFMRFLVTDGGSVAGMFLREILHEHGVSQAQALDLMAKIKKHRKPRKLAERDGKIMALHEAGRTAGEIVLDLPDYDLSDRIVNTCQAKR